MFWFRRRLSRNSWEWQGDIKQARLQLELWCLAKQLSPLGTAQLRVELTRPELWSEKEIIRKPDKEAPSDSTHTNTLVKLVPSFLHSQLSMLALSAGSVAFLDLLLRKAELAFSHLP
jgi:hypothetical protein